MTLPAQAAEIGRAADAAIKSSADYGLIGILFVLLLLASGLGLWMFGKFLARRDDLERTSREKSAEIFTSELRVIREGFDKQLSEQRKQSGDLARSGHLAVSSLSDAFLELSVALAGGTQLSKSGILRMRDSKRGAESVLE